MQGLLDGAPVIFREQYGVAPLTGDLNGLVGLPHLIDQGIEPLAGFCGGDDGNGAALHARTSKRTASDPGQAVRGLRLDGHHLDLPGINV